MGMERKEETRVVKAALQKAGYQNVSVRHGTGTAWGWLDVDVTAPGGYSYEAIRKATDLVCRVTGRTGDYDGKVVVSVEGRD